MASSSEEPFPPMQEIMVEFRAGKMYFQGKKVVPDNRKGLVRIARGDEGLVHFQWLDRSQNVVEDDQIIFPDEAVFEKVNQSSGRVYILKFNTDDRKFIFWMQEPNAEADSQLCISVNYYLNRPLEFVGEEEPDASVPLQVSEDTADDDISSRAGNLIAPSSGAEVSSDVTSSSGAVKLADLQRILSNIGPAGFKLAVPSRSGRGVTESSRHNDDPMEESPLPAGEPTGDLLPRKRKKASAGGEGGSSAREERRLKKAAGRRGEAAGVDAEVEALLEATFEAPTAAGEAEPSSSFFEGMIDLDDVPSPPTAPESSPAPPATGSRNYPPPMTESLEGMRVHDSQFLQPDLLDAAVGFMMQAPARFSFPFQASFRFCHEEKFKAQAEMSLKERMFDQVRLQVESLQSALLSYREVCNMPGKFEDLEVRLATALSERDDHARARAAACAEARAADDRARSVAAEKDAQVADLISRVEDISSIQADLTDENSRMKAELSEERTARAELSERTKAELLAEKSRHAEEKASLVGELAEMKEEISRLGQVQINEAAKAKIIEEYFSSEAAEKRELELMESAAEQIYGAIRERHPDWDISFLTDPSSDDEAADH